MGVRLFNAECKPPSSPPPPGALVLPPSCGQVWVRTGCWDGLYLICISVSLQSAPGYQRHGNGESSGDRNDSSCSESPKPLPVFFFSLLILSLQVRQNCHSHGFSRTLHAGRKTIRPLSFPSERRRPPNSQIQRGQDLLRDSYQYGLHPLPQRRSRPATFSNLSPSPSACPHREIRKLTAACFA